MNQYIEVFIKKKCNEIPLTYKDEINDFLPFYTTVSSDDLAYLFAYLHYKYNILFDFLNYKLHNHHYNADESRELIFLIELYRKLDQSLVGTEFQFKLIDSYLDIINSCEMFLSSSGGSSIPEDFKKIHIVETRPIFELVNTETPLAKTISFDETYIHVQWEKAIERKQTDPEGAITMARTLIESLLKHILDEQNIDHGESMELSELYKEVAKLLNLAPEQHQEKIFKQILGGANGVVSGLGAMRNKLGDAHGGVKTKVRPKERHSELAVNLAGSIAIFIYKTYQENLMEGNK